MTNAVIPAEVALLIEAYDPAAPEACADGLRELWLQFEPGSIAAIKAEERELQETVGIPVPVLKSIGKEVAKTARRRVPDYVPLVRLLWDRYGREGRVVALISLGAMELAAPDCIIPLLKEMCRTCITWEDADRLAMDALEPIVRKKPEEWLTPIEPWLDDQSKWIRRAGIIVIGRLPMKHREYAGRCVRLCEGLLLESEVDVKRAVSFAIRLTARGDVEPVRGLIRQHVPPDDPAATWVLCDTVRSMARKLLPEFVSLLPIYEGWAADPALSTKDRRSVESAVRVLRQVQT